MCAESADVPPTLEVQVAALGIFRRSRLKTPNTPPVYPTSDLSKKFTMPVEETKATLIEGEEDSSTHNTYCRSHPLTPSPSLGHLGVTQRN